MCYHCVMKNTKQVENDSQGARSQEIPSIGEIISFLERDLGLAIRCLQGIHSNPNLKAQLAEWMVGEISNYQQAKKAAAEAVVN